MQLSKSGRLPGVRSVHATRCTECSHLSDSQTKPRGFIATGMQIVQRETPLALYKGLGAVLSGIIPKMAIRFASFETYKGWLADKSTGKTSTGMVFLGMPYRSFGQPPADSHLTFSRSGCWCDRSRCGRDPYGGRQDSTTSAATFSRGPLGDPALSKCRTRSLHHRPGGGIRRVVSRGQSHSSETGN